MTTAHNSGSSPSSPPKRDTGEERHVGAERGDDFVQAQIDHVTASKTGLVADWLEEGALDESKNREGGQSNAAPNKAFPLNDGSGDSGMEIGPYKLLQEIGEGGFGIVYMASQTEPVRRRVAFKIIKPGMDTRQVIARFEAERQALALMQHPNIATVFDAGATSAGRPYFVMELVRGVSLTQFCDRNQLSTRQRLELFRNVCDAIAHAHQKGVIHRDIKPSNILVTLHDGKPVVKVIDFGIAKALEFDLTEKTLFTQYSQRVGTPVYMSPEQAETGGTDVDTRSDVYSLGVLLYELLTGKTPLAPELMQTEGYEAFVQRIRHERPAKPSTRLSAMTQAEGSLIADGRGEPLGQVGRFVRGELDWIVLKSLEKERERRYQTVREFGEDIGRFLKDEAVHALPPSRLYQTRKFAQRHRKLLLSAAIVVATLFLSSIGMTLLYLNSEANRVAAKEGWEAADTQAGVAERERSRAEQEMRNAQEAQRMLEANLYAANLQLAADSWRDAELPAVDVVRALASQVPSGEGVDPREFAWRQQWNEVSQSGLFSSLHAAGPAVVFQPDGSLLSYEGGKEIRIWNGENHVFWRQLGGGFQGASSHLLFSPNGDRLFARSHDGGNQLNVFEVATGKLFKQFDFPGRRVTHDAHREARKTVISPNGRYVCATYFEGGAVNGRGHFARLNDRNVRIAVYSARLWDIEDEKPLRSWAVLGKGNDSRLQSIRHLLAVGPGGDEVAFSEDNGGKSVLLYNPRADKVRRLEGAPFPIGSAVFSKDGKWIAAGTSQGVILWWDLESGSLQGTIDVSGPRVRAIEFSQSGDLLAAGMGNGLVVVVDRVQQRVRNRFKGEIAGIQSLTFAKDETRLAATAVGRALRVWSLVAPETTPLQRVVGHQRVQISKDEKHWVLGGESATTIVSSGLKVVPATIPVGGLSNAISPDGRELLIGGKEGNSGRIHYYDLAQRQLTALMETPEPIGVLGYSPDGRYVVAGGGLHFTRPYTPAHVFVWARGTDEPVAVLGPFRRAVIFAEFSPDGRFLVAGSHHGDLRRWRTSDWQLDKTLRVADSFYLTSAMALSPDHSLVATAAGPGGRVLVHSLDSGKLIHELLLDTELLTALAISPDGRTLAAGRHRFVRLFDLATGMKVRLLGVGNERIRDLRFSPSGDSLLAVSDGKPLHIWKAPSLTAIDTDETLLRVLTPNPAETSLTALVANLSRWQDGVGDFHPSTHLAARRLAIRYYLRGETEKTMQLAEKYMLIANRNYGVQHPQSRELQKAYVNAWETLRMQVATRGDVPDELDLLEKRVPNLETVSQVTRRGAGLIHQRMGEMQLQSGDFSGAVSTLEPVLERRRQHPWEGPSAFVAETAYTLGQAREEMGADRLAEALYREVLANVSTVEEKLDWRSQAAGDRLAHLLVRRGGVSGDFGEARRLWLDCVESDIDRHVTASAATGLALISRTQGLNEDAMRWESLSRSKQTSLATIPAIRSREVLPELEEGALGESMAWEQGRLILNAGGSTAEIRLPAVSADHYRLTVQAHWQSGVGDLNVGLNCGGSQGLVSFESLRDRYESVHMSGVRGADSFPEYPLCHWGRSFKEGAAAEITFVVVPDRIEVFADGEQLFSWKYDFDRFRAKNPWGAADPLLFLQVTKSAEVAVSQVKLEELPGEAE